MSAVASPSGIAPARADVRAKAVPHQAYRPDIDGLRAVAVLAVVAFHAFPFTVPGGFVGVDIFFVISGFLITTIIVDDLAKDRFRYRTFYVRRIKRILPALVITLATVWAVGWLRLYPNEYRQLGEHIVGGSTFLSNLVLRGEFGYFDNDAQTKPLLHLWSLAIEEQFYIFWPLILTLTFRRVASLWTIAAIAVASFAYSAGSIAMTPELAFYSPLSRFWELMIGGLLAQGMRVRPASFMRYGNLRSLAGFALIATALIGYARWVPYPGWRALLPTVGAFLIISAGPNAALNRLLLSNRPAVLVGKVSYPLYLWHWPLLSFVFIAASDAAGPVPRLVMVALAFVLAWLTYRFVETPIRTSDDTGFVPMALLSALAAMGLVGYATMHGDGFAFRTGAPGAYAASFDDNAPEMRYRFENHVFAAFREECNFYDYDRWRLGHSTNLPRAAIDPTCITRPTGTTRALFIWGDSHAEDLNSGLREALPRDVAILQVASSGCSAARVEAGDAARSYCRRSNQFALETIRKEKPEVVLIAQREGHDLARFRLLADELRRDGVRDVLVVGPVPQWKPNLPRVIASEYWDRTPDRLKTHLDAGTVALDRKLVAGLRPAEPFVFVDLFDALCNENGCRTVLDGDRVHGLMTFDYGHLTPRASSFVGRTVLAPAIMRLLDAQHSPAAAQPTSP